ncbi:MAG: hypothetical protein H0V29_05515 [Thermoleophilaceae bacterium]|nr:hypothetical protein [Thermoleophilaceae bacterium]
MSALAYAISFEDAVRAGFEQPFWDGQVTRLLAEAGGGRVVDLGSGDGAVAGMAGESIEEYLALDLSPPADLPHVAHDLRDGLGPVGPAPFDLYLGTYGVASHLDPAELDRLLGDIAAHGRPGSVVALEALGLYSLEWPRLWDTEPGGARALPYRLAQDVMVHPWLPHELAARFERAGLRFTGAIDRTVQFGPKAGEGRYWPGLPHLRPALGALLTGEDERLDEFTQSLPPLPVAPAAAVHQGLAARRRRLVERSGGLSARELAQQLWSLEPATGEGYGHGLLAVGRVA